MAKSSGLGANLYVGTTDVSGDIGSVSAISGGNSPIDVTGIDKSAHERIGGKRDGNLAYMAYYNPSGAHPVFSALPRTDVIVTFAHGTTVGRAAASMVSKQIDYPGNRNDDGSYTFAITAQANGFGLEWGRTLTTGIQTMTGAANGTSIDTLASAAFGGQGYLHVTAFTGTDATIKIQDSADNSSFADVTSFTFGSVTGVVAKRIAIGNTATVRRYVRVAVTTTGGFTSMSFAVNVVKNTIGGQVF